MSSYAGLDEIGLRKLLDTSSDITERRKIRAALRELRTNNNNSVVHPHISRARISPSKLSHHQSFRTERRRRPDIDDPAKKSQDDDILYRSRRRREMDAGKGDGGDDGDDENEAVVDIEMKIKEIANDEHKLTKLLSETRDFNDRRKVRSAIREVKRKTKLQDDFSAPTKSTNHNEAAPTVEPAVTVQQENQTNLALSRSSQGQRSSAEGPEVVQDCQTTSGWNDVDQEIEALQKQIESTETYEERRRLRAEIRELRQKKIASPLTRPNNSPSYNNNSSNTNSNNSRGLVASPGFESSIKPDGAFVLKNHGVREEEEKSSGKTPEVCRAVPLVTGAPSLAEDAKKVRKDDEEKLAGGETREDGRDKSSSSSPSSSSLPTSGELTKLDDDRIASGDLEERLSIANGNQDDEHVSGQGEVVHDVEASSVLPVSSSISPSSLSSSQSPPPHPSAITESSSTISKSSILPEPEEDGGHSVKKDPEVSQETSDDTQRGADHEERVETRKLDETGTDSSSEAVRETREDVEMDADDEASKCDSVQAIEKIKPIPVERKIKSEIGVSSSSSSSSPSQSSSSSSSGSSSEIDEVTGQRKEKRKPKGLKEAMRRRAELKASQLASEPAKEEVLEEEKVEPKKTVVQEASSQVSQAVRDQAVHDIVKDEARVEKRDAEQEVDDTDKNSVNLKSRTVEDSVLESKLEGEGRKVAADTPNRAEDSSITAEEKGNGSDTEELSSSDRQKAPLSLSSVEGEEIKPTGVDKTASSSQPVDDISKVKDTPTTASSSKITMSLHSPITSTTTFPISNSTSPSTSTSENISSVIEVVPKMTERVQSESSDSSGSSSRPSHEVSSPDGEDKQDGAVLSVNKTDSTPHSTDKPMRSISSPATSTTTPTIPRNFGHPLRFHKARDDNAILSPKKTTTSVKRSESAVSSLQAKRNKFLNNRPSPDDDTSPTSSARSFKNIVSGSKFAALREKFSASNGNSNNNTAGPGRYGGYSPSSPSTPKSPWQQKPSSSSPRGGSITEDSSLNSSSEQKKSIYGTPPTTPPTPLPYKTPPESPLDFRSKTASPSAPLASSTPAGAAELKSPTAADLKRQFLFGTDDSNLGDVFTDESGTKDENSNLKDFSMAPIEQIEDEAALEKMLEEATEFDERKKIRSRLREVRKKKRDEREQKAQEQERAFEEKMHKLEVESAQQRMRAVGLNVQTPGERSKTVTETKDDGKTKTVVETTMRDSGSSKSVQMTIMSKTEDEGFKSQTVQQESKSISVGPGGSSSVTMSKTVSSSSSSSTTTDKPKGRPKTKFEEEMELKKKEREEKRKQDEAKFKEQQMQRKKEAYEQKKRQAEEAKNRKAALMNKFGGSGGGGGAKPAGGGGGMRVQNATTIKQKLLEWAQKVTRGYAGVNVTNFSSSWADGLAFCAVIHHYYPDAFDFSTLDAKQRRKNFDLAFNTAEQQADIMPLLDTDDMIMMKNNPDWKCVFTYVQSLYRHLNK